MRTAVRVGDLIDVDDAVWQVLAVAGEEVALRSTDGRRLATRSRVELLSRPIRTVRPLRLPLVEQVGLMEQLSAEQKAEALFWQTHLHEVLTGHPPNAPPDYRPRPEFDPDRTMAQRIAAKTAELGEFGLTPHDLP